MKKYLIMFFIPISSLVGYAEAGEKVTCTNKCPTYTGINYDKITVSNGNATFSENISVLSPIQNTAVDVNEGGGATFESLDIKSISGEFITNFGLRLDKNAIVTVKGNLSIEGILGKNSPGLLGLDRFSPEGSSTLHVLGDTSLIIKEGSAYGHGIYTGGSSHAIFDGKTYIEQRAGDTNSANTLSTQNSSTIEFNELEITTYGKFAINASSTSTVSSTGKTTITNEIDGGNVASKRIGVQLNNSSLVSLGEDASITQSLIDNRSGKAQLNIGKNAEIVTQNDSYAVQLMSGIDEIVDITINGGKIISKDYAIYSDKSNGSDINILLQEGGLIEGNILLQDGDNTLVIKDGTLTGDAILGNGDAYFEATGGKIISSMIDMGIGNNVAYINGDANIDDLKVLSTEDIAGVAQNQSSLTFSNGSFSGWSIDTAETGTELRNWSNLNLTNNASFMATGSKLQVLNQLLIDETSKISSKDDNLTISSNSSTPISLVNNGTMVLNNGTFNRTWSINGNYTGNGKIIVDSLWNNDSSKTDNLHILGTADGYTEVMTKNGIIGNVTKSENEKYSANVITVDDHTANSDKFYGFADTSGAGQAILVQKDANNYAWYLPAGPSTPNTPNTPTPNTPLKPEVPGSVLMPKANINAIYSILGTLHERVSEQQTMAWDDCSTCQIEHNDGQVWGRFIGNYNKVDGKNQFDYKSKLWGLQFGYDISLNYDADKNTRSHTGLIFTYAKDNLQFYNAKNVSFDQTLNKYTENYKKTGHGQSDIYSLGGYYTGYDENGSYLDLVGLINYINNKYDTYDRSNDKNHAYGMTLSAEIGRPYAITTNGINNGDWFIEPQAQLIYQYLKFNSFKTMNDISVDQNNQYGLRGRVGFRLAYNKGTEDLKTQTIYFTGNIIHDVLNQKTIDFGTSSLKEKNANTAGELGIGFQFPLGDTSYFYIDSRYYHSLGNTQATTKQFSGSVGLKYHW